MLSLIYLVVRSVPATRRLELCGLEMPRHSRSWSYATSSRSSTVRFAPHHCSWSVFADSSDDEASEKVVGLFEQRQNEAKIVASSFAIDTENTPPSEKAAQIYQKIVGEDNFYCTGEYPQVDELEPIVFEISGYGVSEAPRDEKDRGGEGVAAATLIRRTPQKYGNGG